MRKATAARRRAGNIEPVGPAHAALLAEIHATAFLPDEAWNAAIFAGHLSLPGTFGFLHAAGGLVLARATVDEAEILTIAVAPEARRHGAGRALLRAAAQAATQRGAVTLFLEVSEANDIARALYESEGFGKVGQRRGYYQDGTDAVVMGLGLGR